MLQTSELISNMSTDIKEDGTLDSKITGSKLLSHAKFIQPNTIKENLKNRYDEILFLSRLMTKSWIFATVITKSLNFAKFTPKSCIFARFM